MLNLELGSVMRSGSQQERGDVSSSGIKEIQPCEKGGACADTPGSVHAQFGPALAAFSASFPVIFTLQKRLGPAHTAQCTKPLLPSFLSNIGWGAGVA